MSTMPDVLASDAFSLTTLTDRVSKMPAKHVQLAAFFESESVSTETVQVDIEAGTIVVLASVDRSDLPEHVTGGRSKSAKSINSVKIGTTVQLTANDINNVRHFGTDGEAETFTKVLNPRLEAASANLDATHENLRAGAFRGIVYDSDGTTVLVNLYTLFGITPAAPVYIDFESLTDLGELRKAFDGVRNGIIDAAGNLPMDGLIAVAGRSAYQAFVNSAPVRDAYDRWNEGAWLRGENRGGFIWQGFEIIEYTGSAVGTNEILVAPKSRGLFRTVYATPDEPTLAGTLGLPTYVIPQPSANTKTWLAEVSSFVAHYCTRPDLLRRIVNGEAP